VETREHARDVTEGVIVDGSAVEEEDFKVRRRWLWGTSELRHEVRNLAAWTSQGNDVNSELLRNVRLGSATKCLLHAATTLEMTKLCVWRLVLRSAVALDPRW
jgi:hypothetical protein